MYFLLGISLMLALLLVINLLVSMSATIAWHVLAPATKNWTARRRAQAIFGLRVFPFIATLIFVFAFLLPAYLLFEPRSSGETVGIELGLLAFVSVIGVGVAACRVLGTWWRTRRLAANWLAHGELISIDNVEIPVYRIIHSFPVIAVVGIFRPRIFIAEQIFDVLDDKEFQAAICHECGHIAAFDNFKRTLMRVCQDLLVFPFGGSLDRVWSENAESAADEYAAQNGCESTALDLASALVKIARVIPPNLKATMPAGAFLIETQIVDVTWRVHHLLQLAESKLFPAKYRPRVTGNVFLLGSSATFVLVLLLASNSTVLYRIHIVLEGIVKFLQ
jgi:Zn-dependent protease with chaperone function